MIIEARKFSNHGFVIIPLKDKFPIIKYAHRRKEPPTDREIDLWFSNGKGKAPKANGIAIAINNTEFGIDTDGDKCESIFLNKLVPNLSAELQDKIHKTMYTKTPRGHHRTFRISSEDFPKGIDERTIVKFEGHSEIVVKGNQHYFTERGSGYEIINDVDCVVTLSERETMQLLDTLNDFKARTSGIKTVLGVLKPHYKETSRHKIALALAGYLHKGGAPKHLIYETIESLASETSDPEIADRLKAVQDTCDKDRDSKEVSGYRALLEVLDGDKQAIAEIGAVFHVMGTTKTSTNTSTVFNFEAEDDEDDEDELKGIDPLIMSKLRTSGVYAILSDNPPVLYVAHDKRRKIIKVVVNFATETTTRTDNNNNKLRQQEKKQIQTLLWKHRLIHAIPIKVIINNSPIDENKTYQITFVGRSKKPFTIGPCSISSVIDKLDSDGKVVRKPEATDALKAILQRYEEEERAEINESVTTQGYYYINDRFEPHQITQIIDREPDPDQMRECAELLDELSDKWHNKDIFPTVIKWATLSPFNYILKTNDKWIRNIHEHGWSSSGKNSLGKIALAIWRLHTNALRKDFQIGMGNIDTAARFGSVISRSTYPKMISEVGGLAEKHNKPLVELVKSAVDSLYVRGKYIEGKYQNIPALCSIFFTSNPPPPDDSGYRGRHTLIHFSKDDVHEREGEEAKKFENWLNSKFHVLGVLGDFIARYVIVKPEKPEHSILFSWSGVKSFDDIEKEILTEFYKAAGKDRPAWLDRIYEQRSIVEENTEVAYFEIRGFLMQQITDAYSRHIRTIYNSEKDPDSGISIDFRTRLNFCLANKLIPYLHEHSRRESVEEIIITHDILAEMKRTLDHIEGITTMEDLGKELSGFEYSSRKLGGKARRVLAGKRADFANFLEGAITREDDD